MAAKQPKPATKGKTGPKPVKLAACDALGIDGLCEKLIAGESQTAIAKGLDVSLATLINWIAGNPERSARAREARVTAASSYADKAEKVLEEADSPLGLAKARELASHYRWKASKANPREFGEKIEIEQKTTLTDLTEEQLDAKLAKLLAAGG